MVLIAACTAFLTPACAPNPHLPGVEVKAPVTHTKPAPKLTKAQARAWHRFLVHLAFAAWLEGLKHQQVTSPVFACIANAETGGDETMHGPIYSTAFGMMNEIVTDYGNPEVAARIFAGQGTFSEELDIAVRFVADHGFGGWGVLTKEKCGL